MIRGKINFNKNFNGNNVYKLSRMLSCHIGSRRDWQQPTTETGQPILGKFSLRIHIENDGLIWNNNPGCCTQIEEQIQVIVPLGLQLDPEFLLNGTLEVQEEKGNVRVITVIDNVVTNEMQEREQICCPNCKKIIDVF